jgi:membrane protease subunit HflC
MKKNYLNLITGLVLLLVFVALLFCFQVRQTEVALVTTFGKPTRTITESRAFPYFKWPWPIQSVQKFDKRIQSFEEKFEETLTKDSYNVIITIYLGWSINDPAVFRERFNGSVVRAENELATLVRSAKNAVVGQHPFAHFISTDEKELKFNEIEGEMLAAIQPVAKANYGIDVRFLGIKQLGLPESITQKVFDRMKEERQRFVQKLQADGEARASDIRSAANRERSDILTKAEAEVTELRGKAEAEAAKSLAVFKENPELAVFLLKINALGETLKERATLILDQRTPPFDLLGNDAPGTSKPIGSK